MEATQAAPEVPHVTYPRFTTRMECRAGFVTEVYDRQHWHARFKTKELADEYAEWMNERERS